MTQTTTTTTDPKKKNEKIKIFFFQILEFFTNVSTVLRGLEELRENY